VIAALQREIDAAVAASRTQRGRAPDEIARILAAAGARWRADAELAAALPDAARLDRTMVATILPLVAEQLDVTTMSGLARHEATGPHPTLVACVLASNVPCLAIPAIALGCLAGAAVVVKSGRGDTVSAPALRRALDALDPDLARRVVTAYWPGGSADVEDRVLGRADVVVASGSDASMAALARRAGPRLRAHGARTSVAVVRDDADDAGVAALADDVVLYEQRGCLSPTTVFVVGDACRFAERLYGALIVAGQRLPRAVRTTAERAAHRVAIEEARFAGATIFDGAEGTVVAGERGLEPIGQRTVGVRPLRSAADLAAAIEPGTIECVGVAGLALDVEALRRAGVARVCPLGRMQRPRLDWPRGQRPALGSLFQADAEPRIQVDA
jgi:acyl-CoA reductase-like NAD-dependent aldehyde dehydrogenase